MIELGMSLGLLLKGKNSDISISPNIVKAIEYQDDGLSLSNLYTRKGSLKI